MRDPAAAIFLAIPEYGRGPPAACDLSYFADASYRQPPSHAAAGFQFCAVLPDSNRRDSAEARTWS